MEAALVSELGCFDWSSLVILRLLRAEKYRHSSIVVVLLMLMGSRCQHKTTFASPMQLNK